MNPLEDVINKGHLIGIKA